MNRTPYQELSNLISIASDTGDRATLDACDSAIATCLAEGKINLPEAGELTLDCETALAAIDQDDGLYLTSFTERTLDEVENA